MELILQLLLERNVVEAQIVCIENDGSGGIDAAGDHNAYVMKILLGNTAFCQKGTDGLRQFLGHTFTTEMGEGDGGSADDLQIIIHQTDLHVGAADIDTDLIQGNHPSIDIIKKYNFIIGEKYGVVKGQKCITSVLENGEICAIIIRKKEGAI